jgi:perosamine synthetase
MPNINAALGLAQLEQLPVFLEKKRMTAKAYMKFFREKNIEFISEPDNSKSNYWLNTILFRDKNERNNFLNFSNEHKVMTRPAWELMNKLKMFNNCLTDDLKNSYELVNKIVNIPSSVIFEAKIQ